MSFANRTIGYSATFGTPAPTTWTNRVSPTYGMVTAAANETTFIVAGAGSFPFPTLYSSTNGVTWTSQTVGNTGGAISSSIWANSKFLVGSASGVTATSPDGATWTISSQLGSTSYGTSAVNALVYLSSYGFVCAGGSSNAAVSSDGVTWTYRGGLQTAWNSSITALCGATDGSIYCFGGTSGRIATTSDSVTWTNRTGLSSTAWGTSNVNGMAYGNGRFVVVGGNSGSFPITAYSSDGINWTYNGTLPSPSGANPFMPARSIIWTGSFFVAGLENAGIATSPDGITWTGISSLYNLSAWGTRQVYGLASNANMTVAAGYSSSSTGRIATSP